MTRRLEIPILLSLFTFTITGPGLLAGAQNEAPLSVGQNLAPQAQAAAAVATGRWRIIGWNDLGVQAFNGADFSVASLQPLRNVIHAQVIDITGPRLVAQPGAITVTYQAIATPSGSINTTSQSKTNFWQYVQAMFGKSLPFDSGLKGFSMPGPANTPQPMTFDATRKWFTADAVPITPFDDAGNTNYYPMMRLVAKDTTGAVVATTDIVLPVSDEMNCKTCHTSNSNPHAQPTAGWVNNPDPAKDVKLNILRIHDQLHAPGAFQAIFTAAKYSTSGLEATANSGTPVLCERCHLSNSLAGLGVPGNSAVPTLTRAIHFAHLRAPDPSGNGKTLADSPNRAVCYLCHPGPSTQFLRGAMGHAVASDGTNSMHCQSCHGTGTDVSATTRKGWVDEPACQSCHTGSALTNGGQIRFTSVFDQPGHVRVGPSNTFATKPNVPVSGQSQYRFSAGHASLQCEACHGSTHAEYPSAQANDNVQSINLQGHVGMLSECSICHATLPTTGTGGPHGLHPLGQTWINLHGAAAIANRAQCQICHAADYSGTVLSLAQAGRTLNTKFGNKTFWRGFRVGCYACHNGPNGGGANTNHAPVISNATAVTAADTSVPVTLNATDADNNALTYRVVSQPAHGTAGLTGSTATYIPAAGYHGTDQFTIAAWDGKIDSNLGTVTITVQ